MAKDNFKNKNIYDTVRKNIKKYRKLKNMTQQDLADASYLSHGYIREIESIRMARTFSLDAVEKIANGLEIDFKLLFENEN
jgi:transcriptional regulator with XRE-family HTH domain